MPLTGPSREIRGPKGKDFKRGPGARKGLDPDCSIRVYRSFFKQVFKWPLSGCGRGQNTPVTPNVGGPGH